MTVDVANRLGLHARAAAKVVELTKTFSSRITLAHGGDPVDAKSIMRVMLLAAPMGTRLELTVEGDDEEEAAAAVCALFENRFGEGE